MISIEDFEKRQSGNGGISKLLSPGTHYCKIADIQFQLSPYDSEAMNITLLLAGPDLPDFEGMVIDRLDPSKGSFKGQAAFVQAGQYPFKTYKPDSAKDYTIKREDQIARFIYGLAKELNVIDKMKEDGFKGGDTEEEFIANATPYLCNGGYLYITIAGKEKDSDYGIQYNRYLPKSEKRTKGGVQPYFGGEEGMKDSELNNHMVVFDEIKHIIKMKNEEEDIAASSPIEFSHTTFSGGVIYTPSSSSLTKLMGSTISESTTGNYEAFPKSEEKLK